MGKLIKKLADPAGLFTGKPKIADALDPGGAVIKSATGSDIGRKIADPANLFDLFDPQAPESLPGIQHTIKQPITTQTEKLAASTEAGRAQQILEKKRKGKRSTVLTSGLGLTDVENIQRPTVLGVG